SVTSGAGGPAGSGSGARYAGPSNEHAASDAASAAATRRDGRRFRLMAGLWHAVARLQQQRLVGQFVPVTRGAGKMPVKQRRGAVDGRQCAFRMATGAEMRLRLATDLVPLLLWHHARQGAV